MADEETTDSYLLNRARRRDQSSELACALPGTGFLEPSSSRDGRNLRSRVLLVLRHFLQSVLNGTYVCGWGACCWRGRATPDLPDRQDRQKPRQRSRAEWALEKVLFLGEEGWEGKTRATHTLKRWVCRCMCIQMGTRVDMGTHTHILNGYTSMTHHIHLQSYSRGAVVFLLPLYVCMMYI